MPLHSATALSDAVNNDIKIKGLAFLRRSKERHGGGTNDHEEESYFIGLVFEISLIPQVLNRVSNYDR